MKERFRIRPGYKSKELLIEFCGDHRSDNFPHVSKILCKGLNSRPITHPEFDTSSIALSLDRYISMWEYENGHYELDDDIWSLFILVQNKENNAQIIKDIENVLIKSGLFEKELVDSSKYA